MWYSCQRIALRNEYPGYSRGKVGLLGCPECGFRGVETLPCWHWDATVLVLGRYRDSDGTLFFRCSHAVGATVEDNVFNMDRIIVLFVCLLGLLPAYAWQEGGDRLSGVETISPAKRPTPSATMERIARYRPKLLRISLLVVFFIDDLIYAPSGFTTQAVLPV